MINLKPNDSHLRHCSTLLSCATWDSRSSLRASRILVGMDFSDASESGRRLAVGLARSWDAALDLVHVFDVFTETFIRNNTEVLERANRKSSDQVDQALARRARMARAQGVRPSAPAWWGTGVELAVHAARTGADLIVLADIREVPGRFGWTWGRRAADQIVRGDRWRGTVLLRSSSAQ